MIIYKAENKINGKIYIGKTVKSINDRLSRHYFQPSNSLFPRALKKYGRESFDVSVIDWADNQNDLNEKEKFWITFYNCRYPNGYNMTAGGDGMAGLFPSAETREKIRLGKLGNQAWLGKHHTEETKRKCSLAKIGNKGRIGIPQTEATKAKLRETHSGDKSSSAKLSWEQVREIRNVYRQGSRTQSLLAKIYGVTASTMNSLLQGKTWLDVGR